MKKVLLCLLVCLTTHTTLCIADPLLVAIGGLEEGTDSFRIAQSIATEMALRSGTEITLMAIPSKRVNAYLRSEEIDGNFSRTGELSQESRGLIRVAEPAATFPIYAYVTRKDLVIDEWESLKPYKVAYTADTQFIESKLMSNKTEIFPFVDVAAGLNFLASGRVDVFVHSPFVVEALLKKDEWKETGIHALLPPIDFLLVHLDVLPKHAELAKRFEIALRNMKDDKTYHKIMSGEL